MKINSSYLLGRRSLLFFFLIAINHLSSFSQVCSLSNLPSNLQNGLIAYYPFCGNTNDVSGNNNTLQSFGLTASTDRFGNSNSAYSFSNTQTNVTSYLKATNPSPFATSNYSISAWFNTSQFYPSISGLTYNYQQIVSYSPQWYQWGTAYGLSLKHTNNSIINSEHWTFADGYQGVTSPDNTVSTNQWYHAVQTYDGTTLKLYINGSLVSSISVSLSYADQTQFLIGCRGDGPSPGGLYGGFNGKLDDIGFWNKALCAAEVSQLYSQTSSSIPPSSFTINSLSDTTRVCGINTTLNAGTGYSSYSWNTGATTQSISATTSGFYKVTVTNASGCVSSDSTYLSLINARIINNDTTICLGNNIRLSVDSIFPNRTACTKDQLPASMRDGLLAYYPFCGNANNALGTGNNGTVYNATLTTDRFGNASSAYSFNGTNAYIDFGSNTSIGPTSTISTSISLWVSGSATGNVISKYTNLDATNSYFYFNRSANGYQWVGNGTTPYINNTGVTDSEWTHYVLVGVAGSNNSKVYRNGVLIATGTLAMNSTMRAVSLLVGRVGASFPGYLNGKVDDVFIYNKALTLSEIQNLYLYQPRVTWSTGAITNSILVSPTQSTTYYVDITDGVNTCRDSVRVNVSDLSTFNPLSDTTRICGTSTVLNAGNSYATYLWNTGATSQSISPTSSGLYKVTVSDSYGCLVSDSTQLSIINANILNNDTTICKGSTITLSIDSLFSRVVYPIHTNNFNSSSSFWTNYRSLNYNSQVLAGNYINDSLKLVLQSLPLHDSLLVNMDLYLFDSWDGNCGGVQGPDYWGIALNGIVPFKTTFSNYPTGSQTCSNLQAFPGQVGSANPWGTGADARNLPSIAWSANVSTKYLFNKAFAHNNSNLNLAFFGNNLQSDESWGIDNIAVNAILSRPQVTWSTGETSNSITVSPNQTTTYYVTITDGITVCRDSVTITVSYIGSFNPLSDTTRVCGTSTVLNAGSGYASYSWNTTAITQSVTANVGGFYKVTVTNENGCLVSDSTIVSIINAKIENSDTTICNGSSITLAIDSQFVGRTACTIPLLKTNLQQGLVAYYPFCDNYVDQFSGTTALNQGAIKISDRFNIPNSAIYLDGSSWLEGLSSNLPIGSTARTVCFWYKEAQSGSGIGNNAVAWGPNIQGNRFDVSFNHQVPGLSTGAASSAKTMQFINNNVNNWNFYCAVVPAISNPRVSDVKLYQNGIELTNVIYSVSINTLLNTIASTPLIIGKNTDLNDAAYLQGSFDDLFIYNRALTSNEIQSLYTTQPTVSWSTGATTNSIIVSPAQTTTYYVDVSDGITTCRDSVIITVSNPPSAGSLSGTQAICIGGTSTFSSTVTGGSWSSSDVSIATVNSSTGVISGVAAGTATMTYTVNGTGGCADVTATRVVTVTAAPSAGTLSGTQAICIGGTSTFSSTVTGGSWSSSDVSIATVNSSTGAISGVAAGTATITYTVAGTGGCADVTATRVVTVTAAPSAGTLSGTQAICVAGTSTLSSTVSSGSWSSSATSIATINSSTGVVSGLAAGTATMTYTVAGTGGCADATATRAVTVTAAPSAGTLSGTQAICVGGSTTFSSTITTGSWSSSDVTVASINPSSGIIVGIAAGTATMTYTVASTGGCANAVATRTVTVNSLPAATITASGSTSFCSGASVILTASNGLSYSWNTGETTQSITVSSQGSYVVTITNSNNCSATSLATTVTVNPKPTVAFSINNPNQCVTNNNFSFNNSSSISSGTLSYQWSFGDGGSSIIENPTYSYTNPGIYVVKLVVTSALGCKDSTTRSITVFERPQPSFSINSFSQCVNENSFVFTNNTVVGSGSATYVWSFGDGGGSNSTNPTYTYTTSGTFIVKLVAISNNGCSDSTTQTVTVNPKPSVSFSINNENQCLTGNQYVFTSQSTISNGTLTHQWQFGDGNISTQPIATYSYNSPATYIVTLVSASDAGCRDSVSRTVTVYPMPAGTLVTPISSLLCEGGSVLLSATGGMSYQWLLNGGTIAGATNATHSATQPGSYTVNLISSNNCIAQANGVVVLQLVQKPIANFTYDKYCAGFPTQFTDQSSLANSNTVTYSWSFGVGQATSSLQNPSYTFPAASGYIVTLSVVPVACPSLVASISKTITTVMPPANQRYVSLNAVESRNLQLEARPFGGATYNWFPASGLSNTSTATPIFNYNAEVEYVITITTGVGCVIKDTQLVRIFKEKEIYVPKGFSPNGDGNNDKIFPRLVGVRSLAYFKVYNRWGQLIFQTSKDGEGWDGTFRGTKQPMESYVWMAEGVDIDNNLIKRTGTFLLLR